MKTRIVGFYNYTVVLTYIGSLAGLLGVCSAVRGDARAAAICLMASGLCDLFDGTVAQTRARTAQEKRFGVQIDSLSDLVSFGVQPAAIGYCIGVRGAQVIVLCCYVLAALIRLAYYNVTEDELLEEGSGRDAYEGLPVTTATIMRFRHPLSLPAQSSGPVQRPAGKDRAPPRYRPRPHRAGC